MEKQHLIKNQNTHTIHFEPDDKIINQIPTGALLSDVARQANLDMNMPCGGQGRCGRCAVITKNGTGIRRRSTVRLSPDDLADGYVLACQAVVEGDAVVTIPPQEKIERLLVTDKTATKVRLPFVYDPAQQQSVRLFPLTLDPPNMDDQTDDWSRLKRAMTKHYGLSGLRTNLSTLQNLGPTLRKFNWNVTAIVETDTWDHPEGLPRLIDLLPASGLPIADSETTIQNQKSKIKNRLWGAAVDIGTTTVSLYLVDLLTGEVFTKAAEYNGQIKRGEDVISRIIYASKNDGLAELQSLVLDTINELLERAARRAKINPATIYKMVVTGNSTMIHLLLGLSPDSIRLDPFITTVNQPPPVRASELGLNIYPQASVDCLPGVASYVGADISSGVVGAQMCVSSGDTTGDELVLFLDVGTNGEMVMGDCDWLISCACSAGPAFEGAGVKDGMRATTGAIEEVWINSETYNPTYRVIPRPKLEIQGQATPPRGMCGSGLISLLAEMFITGVIDKSGNMNFTHPKEDEFPQGGEASSSSQKGWRVRQGSHGPEYVVAWADETEHGEDIVITKVDIDNLLRAKGAIYAGFTVLAQSVGVEMEMVERMLIGGSFGQYINIEKAIQIGLLPDMPWEKFHFLGNTALQGALLALLNREYRQQITEVAAKMTYLELSADNTFYDQFTSALFLPHTNIEDFPTVAKALKGDV